MIYYFAINNVIVDESEAESANAFQKIKTEFLEKYAVTDFDNWQIFVKFESKLNNYDSQKNTGRHTSCRKSPKKSI